MERSLRSTPTTATSSSDAEKLLKELLKHNRNAIHPGKGRQDCDLVRRICATMGWNEDDYLQDMYIREKSIDPKYRKFYR